jgi:DNA-binding GntR family transcriptional regulator
VLCTLWAQLSRQITIIVRLSTLDKSMRELVLEHRALLDALASRDMARIEREMMVHIVTQNEVIDYESLIEERRRKRTRAA